MTSDGHPLDAALAPLGELLSHVRQDPTREDRRLMLWFGGDDGVTLKPVKSLSREMAVVVGRMVVRALHHRDQLKAEGHRHGDFTDDQVYLFTIQSLGLSCPHPRQMFIELPGVPPGCAWTCPVCDTLFVRSAMAVEVRSSRVYRTQAHL